MSLGKTTDELTAHAAGNGAPFTANMRTGHCPRRSGRQTRLWRDADAVMDRQHDPFQGSPLWRSGAGDLVDPVYGESPLGRMHG